MNVLKGHDASDDEDEDEDENEYENANRLCLRVWRGR
jgi:hypothetical protein